MIKKLRKIKLLLLDVDGVMTDGGIFYSGAGVEMKRFNAHDGYGVVRAREHGLKLGIISGRQTPVVDVRAKELQIEDVMQNAADKVAAMEELRRRHGFEVNEVAFIGDDLFDLPLLNAVGFSAAPKNALPDVKKAVDYVTKTSGGDGAVRELIDLIIKSQSR
ncbi:MAG TPA: phenylphosphate carboxylase subunit delta [Bacteroidetes bacterium]|nr:phenylphosphate carboxylase subunit delta [Bacteroidota bacterium]